MKKNFKHTNHSYLRYANCWEDADVLLSALNIQATDSVISIASAGDNTFSILSKSPQKVVAVDINEVQLHLTELKKACFLTLSHSEFLAFLGFSKSDKRKEVFEKIKVQLSKEAIIYWSDNFEQIENGIIHQGKFENYFKLFRTKVIPLIHSKKRVNQLLAIKTNDEQLAYYSNKWNTWRWRLLFSFFFSKTMMAKFGRDKSLFNEVEVNVKDFMFNQAQKEVSTTKCQTNYFLNYILKGNFGNTLPHYARLENFENIKQNCHKLELRKGLIEDVLTENERFDKFNLSNIFEYISDSEFSKLSNSLAKHSHKNAFLLNWSLMVKRNLSEINSNFTVKNTTTLHQQDNGFFYRDLKLHQLK